MRKKSIKYLFGKINSISKKYGQRKNWKKYFIKFKIFLIKIYQKSLLHMSSNLQTRKRE
jgi:hypothetical protein